MSPLESRAVDKGVGSIADDLLSIPLSMALY